MEIKKIKIMWNQKMNLKLWIKIFQKIIFKIEMNKRFV